MVNSPLFFNQNRRQTCIQNENRLTSNMDILTLRFCPSDSAPPSGPCISAYKLSQDEGQPKFSHRHQPPSDRQTNSSHENHRVIEAGPANLKGKNRSYSSPAHFSLRSWPFKPTDTLTITHNLAAFFTMACESCRSQARTLLRVATRTSVSRSSAAKSVFLPLHAPVRTPPPSRSFSSTSSRKILGGLGSSIGESYRVLGASERLFKACSKAADYRITEEERKNDQVERLEDGEEIGHSLGDGNIWHNSASLGSSQHHPGTTKGLWLTLQYYSFQALPYL